MCGIFVAFSKKGTELSEKRCISASKEIYNRGPDFFKYSFLRNRTLYMSNTILSITGKPTTNKEVSFSKNKNFYISFNGEIYNYKNLCKEYLPQKNFYQNLTDTEVLTDLYEKKNSNLIPKLLNGMFAYVIYDKSKDKLSIVNDVQGEKNLYYFQDNNVLLISSTINAILKFVKNYKIEINPIENYFLTRHYMPNTETCFKGVKTFNNGHIFDYNLFNNSHQSHVYETPYDWISEKKYNEFDKMKENDLINFFDSQLNKQAKLMIPKIKYGSIVSGGIDSTLQAAIINQYKDLDEKLVIDHEKKDRIMKHIYKFNPYFKKDITKIKLNKNKYIKLANQCYQIISSPMQTHDLPARLEISNFFKKKNCKVFFSADGCDELFGGQQVYYNIFKKKYDYKLNKSPYSSLIDLRNVFNSEKTNYYKKYLDNTWSKSLLRYDFINSKKDKNIQSSLFSDYFVQSINVANRSNDLISCSNSVEPRNIFISKNILKIIINLPLKYKLNYKEKKMHLRQKFILKKIFSKYFNEKLIYPKEGFSGFPNSLKRKSNNYYLTKKSIKVDKKILLKNINKYYDLKNLKRDVEWKLINTEKFLHNYLSKKVN